MDERRQQLDQAIVIGGSMGGLLAARVLADHYKRVTVLERDEFPMIGQQRRGVPQGQHTHGLLAGGRKVITRLFPGTNELVGKAVVHSKNRLKAEVACSAPSQGRTRINSAQLHSIYHLTPAALA